MNSARYGRMQLGRCISGELNVGCTLPVINYVDSQCSGRSFCDMKVRDLVVVLPCQKDFMSYLEASFSCVNVYVAKKDFSSTILSSPSSNSTSSSSSLVIDNCFHLPPLNASLNGKILLEIQQNNNLNQYNYNKNNQNNNNNNINTNTNNNKNNDNNNSIKNNDYNFQNFNPFSSNHLLGTESCPWRLEVLQGQRIKLKILVIGKDSLSPANFEEFLACNEKIIIEEKEKSEELNACDGRNRERTLYSSTSSSLHFFIITPFFFHDDTTFSSSFDDIVMVDQSKESSQDGEVERRNGQLRFIISYSAIGCPDLFIKYGHWMRKSQDTGVIRCNHSLDTWHLTCQHNKWIGSIGNCSQGVRLLVDMEGWLTGGHVFPTLGILLAVLLGIGLGIMIGMTMLLVVHCLRRRSLKDKNHIEGLISSSIKQTTEPLYFPANCYPTNQNVGSLSNSAPSHSSHLHGCFSFIDLYGNNENNSSSYPVTTGNFSPDLSSFAIPTSFATMSRNINKNTYNNNTNTNNRNKKNNSKDDIHSNCYKQMDENSMSRGQSLPKKYFQQQISPQQHAPHPYSVLYQDECCSACLAHNNNDLSINKIKGNFNNNNSQGHQYLQQNESLLYPIGLRNPEGNVINNQSVNNINNNNNSKLSKNVSNNSNNLNNNTFMRSIQQKFPYTEENACIV